MQKTNNAPAPKVRQKAIFLIKQTKGPLVSLVLGTALVAYLWPAPPGWLLATRFWASIWLPLLYVLMEGWYAVKEMNRRLRRGDPI